VHRVRQDDCGELGAEWMGSARGSPSRLAIFFFFSGLRMTFLY
jgi:hypothetical protein